MFEVAQVPKNLGLAWLCK